MLFCDSCGPLKYPLHPPGASWCMSLIRPAPRCCYWLQLATLTNHNSSCRKTSRKIPVSHLSFSRDSWHCVYFLVCQLRNQNKSREIADRHLRTHLIVYSIMIATLLTLLMISALAAGKLTCRVWWTLFWMLRLSAYWSWFRSDDSVLLLSFLINMLFRLESQSFLYMDIILLQTLFVVFSLMWTTDVIVKEKVLNMFITDCFCSAAVRLDSQKQLSEMFWQRSHSNKVVVWLCWLDF